MSKEEPREEEEKFPRDFDLPMEDLDPEDRQSEILQGILDGSMEPPAGDIRLSPEEFIIVSSTISLYSSYVSYVREMDEGLHRRAVEFSSDTVDLHPNVVLTDSDGNPIGRFAENAEETDADDDPPIGI